MNLKHNIMKTFKIVFVISLLLLTGINVYAENPNKTNQSVNEQNKSGYYIYGRDDIYSQIGRRYTIMGDKPANVRVEWDLDDLHQVTNMLQYIVVVREKALGEQTIKAHVTGDNLDIVLTKKVIAIDGVDPNPSDTGYIPEWW